MKINIQNSSLAVTAGLAAQFPDGRKPQIVFSGRSNVGPTSVDFMMLDWLDATESDYVIVATKSDKLNRTDYALALTELEKLGAKVIPFSALSTAGRDEVLKTVFDFLN